MSTPTVVFSGKHFKVMHEAVPTEDGGHRTFEFVWRTDGARILALKDGLILLTREFRHELGDFDWRIPGGKVDPGETPLEAAKRELREETGVRANDWQFLWSSTPDSTVRYQRHFYLATNIELGSAANDLGEDITPEWVSVDRASQLALAGDIREEISALAVLRLRHFGLHSQTPSRPA